MNDPFENLREISWRRPLTPPEQAQLRDWLAQHPSVSFDWEIEAALNQQLARLPDVPVPSNFTHRVLQTVAAQTARSEASPPSRWAWVWHSILPKAALATVFLWMGIMAVREARFEKQQRFAKSLKTITAVASLPGPDILKDFDAIQQLNRSPAPDREWLALLQ